MRHDPGPERKPVGAASEERKPMLERACEVDIMGRFSNPSLIPVMESLLGELEA
jgi:hypothetical protein